MTPTADRSDVTGRPAATRGRRFSKMHGAGNDFVMLDLRHGAAPPSPGECRALADRHRGVGCDQILTIEAPRASGALAAYRIWNADGSASRQCGNGARCVAAWLMRDAIASGAALPARFSLDSPAGVHVVDALGADASGTTRFRVAMGIPDFTPAAVPLRGFAEAQDSYALDVDGVELAIAAVSLGNPHVVIAVEDVDHAPVASVGMAVQRHAALPESANVGFAQVVSRSRVRLRVCERGVGETLACGSGACAAAVVLIRRGLVDRAITVSLPGGDLQIVWPDDAGEVTMAGPAAFVYEGEWSA